MPVWSFKPNLFIKENKQTKKKLKHKRKQKLHSSTRINTTSMQEQTKNIGDGTSPAMTL